MVLALGLGQYLVKLMMRGWTFLWCTSTLDKDFQLTDSLNRELLTIYEERQPSV